MILQALADYYEYLLAEHPDCVASPGWCSRQVQFILELSPEGCLVGIIPSEEDRGWRKTVPEQAKRASNIDANLLCDNATYFLGIGIKGNPERACQCFEAAKERHISFLSGIDSPRAAAVCRFFETWRPDTAVDNPVVVAAGEKLLAGCNLIFCVDGFEVLSDPAVNEAWNCAYAQKFDGAPTATCLVSGKQAPVARLHPSIKGIAGAQSMGASLVSFNERAFESYGHDKEQGLNAPVSERVVFAYTTALNYLLADRKHHIRLGDTTVVYWADKNDEACAEIMYDFLDARPQIQSGGKGGGESDPDQLIDDIMERLACGHPIEGVDLSENFFVLGLAPNAARLAVRFFQRDTFGAMLRNIKNHYERIEIAHASYEKKYLTPYRLLAETENPNAKQKNSNDKKKTATSILGGALMRSILSDSPYPEALFENALLRVRATQDNDDPYTRKVTRGRAAIIKAYLLKNRNRSKEEITVGLNENRADVAYVLGRLFAVLEDIQVTTARIVNNTELNATIKNKYYDSACATPSITFALIDKLCDKHLDKLSRVNPGLARYYDELRTDLMGRIDIFPKRLTLEEQGNFILGYHHQVQKRYEKKSQIINQGEEA